MRSENLDFYAKGDKLKIQLIIYNKLCKGLWPCDYEKIIVDHYGKQLVLFPNWPHGSDNIPTNFITALLIIYQTTL